MTQGHSVAALILAGGVSERMGCAKLLLTHAGKPLVVRAAEVALAAGLSPVVVVTGAYDQEVRGVLAGLAVDVASNGLWETGQSSSIRAGVRFLRERIRNSAPADAATKEIAGLVIMVADQPYISADALKNLVSCFEKDRCTRIPGTDHDPGIPESVGLSPDAAMPPIVVTAVGERLGNPALFPIEYWDELEALTGDEGARRLFSKYPLIRCVSEDERIFVDVDTPEDYEALRASLARRSRP